MPEARVVTWPIRLGPPLTSVPNSPSSTPPVLKRAKVNRWPDTTLLIVPILLPAATILPFDWMAMSLITSSFPAVMFLVTLPLVPKVLSSSPTPLSRSSAKSSWSSAVGLEPVVVPLLLVVNPAAMILLSAPMATAFAPSAPWLKFTVFTPVLETAFKTAPKPVSSTPAAVKRTSPKTSPACPASRIRSVPPTVWIATALATSSCADTTKFWTAKPRLLPAYSGPKPVSSDPSTL